MLTQAYQFIMFETQQYIPNTTITKYVTCQFLALALVAFYPSQLFL